MVDSVTAVQAVNTTQPTVAPQSAATAEQAARIDDANNAAYLNQVFFANAEQGIFASEPPTTLTNSVNGTITQQEKLDFNQNLLNLGVPSLQALEVLNDIGPDPRSSSITGNLTPEQIQAIGVLIADEQRLEEASLFTTPIPLTNEATTVDLSASAQDILDANALLSANNTAAVTATTTTTAPTAATAQLTDQQLIQLGGILNPVAGQPLNAALLAQLQTQVNARMQNPVQLSLNTIFLVLNYFGNGQQTNEAAVRVETPASRPAGAAETVAPTAPVAEATAEDSAILHFNV